LYGWNSEVASSLTTPSLVIHGTDDSTVPLRTSEALRASRPDQVTLTVVPGAEHVESWNVDPRAYDDEVAGFLHGL
jgi:fermentation-respiration switch protein FrsA (DUF1100 family)